MENTPTSTSQEHSERASVCAAFTTKATVAFTPAAPPPPISCRRGSLQQRMEWGGGTHSGYEAQEAKQLAEISGGGRKGTETSLRLTSKGGGKRRGQKKERERRNYLSATGAIPSPQSLTQLLLLSGTSSLIHIAGKEHNSTQVAQAGKLPLCGYNSSPDPSSVPLLPNSANPPETTTFLINHAFNWTTAKPSVFYWLYSIVYHKLHTCYWAINDNCSE